MTTIRTSHKLGPNQKEAAHSAPKRDKNFSQSRDIFEDRCQRQGKTVRKAGSYSHLPKGK